MRDVELCGVTADPCCTIAPKIIRKTSTIFGCRTEADCDHFYRKTNFIHHFAENFDISYVFLLTVVESIITYLHSINVEAAKNRAVTKNRSIKQYQTL